MVLISVAVSFEVANLFVEEVCYIMNCTAVHYDHIHVVSEDRGVDPAYVLHVMSIVILAVFLLEVNM